MPNHRTLLASRFAIAVAIAAGLNVWLQAAHPLSNAPTANLDTGEVSHALVAWDKFRSAKANEPANKIVLLGSSLMVAPVLQSEANYLGAPIERMNHRRCQFVESLFPGRPQVFCFAVGGEMISDAFLLVHNMLNGGDKPDAIIFGIAPRDFQDNLLPGVESTETFKLLASPGETVAALRANDHTFERTSDVLLTQFVPLWKYRSDIQTYAQLRSKKMMEAACPWVLFEKFGPNGVLRPSHKGQLPEEVKGTPHVLPQIALNHASVEATRAEYLRRYNPLNPSLIGLQFNYFNRLLDVCQREHIKTLVVNMPLSEQNLALMPAGFYSTYKDRVENACTAHRVELLDMNHAPYQSAELYADGVHLGSAASQNFLSAVCDRMRNSTLVVSPSRAVR